MPDETATESVSREAHQRVTTERDQLKAQLAEATKALADVNLRDKVYDHVASIDGVKDPFRLASAAVRDMRGVPEDELPTRVGEWYRQQAELFTPATVGSPPSPPEPPLEATETPKLAGGYTPNAAGESPRSQPQLATSSPEVKAIIAKEGIGGLKRLVAEGRVQFRPENQHGQQLLRSAE